MELLGVCLLLAASVGSDRPETRKQPLSPPLPHFQALFHGLAGPTPKSHALHQRSAPRSVMLNKVTKPGVVSRLAS